MQICLFLRTSENWSAIKTKDASFHKQQNHIPAVQRWNAIFSISWQKYREALKQKAISSWPLKSLTTLTEVISLNDEDVIIPIDDDDWLHPEIEEFIRREMKDADILQWSQIVNQYTSKRIIERWGDQKFQRHQVFSTSDHCLSIRRFKKLSNKQQYQVLNGHMQVYDILKFSRRYYVPESMSCYNRHPGSLSFLKHNPDLNCIAKKRIEIPEWAKWAEESIRWLDNETDQLLLSAVKQL